MIALSLAISVMAVFACFSSASAFVQGGAHNYSHMNGREFTYFSTGQNCINGNCKFGKFQKCRQLASRSGIPPGPTAARINFVVACLRRK
jgi:hypothetical protein